MKLLRIALFCPLLWASPAMAFESTGNPIPADVTLATDYTKIADSFGDFQLAALDRTTTSLRASYTLKGETTANWTQLVTAQFFGADPDPDRHEKQVARMIDGWNSLLDGKTPSPLPQHKLSFETLNKSAAPPATEPLHGAIFEYLVGDGDKREDNAAIIHAFPRPAGIVVFQYQKRNHQTISADDMGKMRYILNWSLSTLNGAPAMSVAPAKAP